MISDNYITRKHYEEMTDFEKKLYIS